MQRRPAAIAAPAAGDAEGVRRTLDAGGWTASLEVVTHGGRGSLIYDFMFGPTYAARLPGLLVEQGQPRPQRGLPRGARREADIVTHAPRWQARRIQETDGLEPRRRPPWHRGTGPIARGVP